MAASLLVDSNTADGRKHLFVITALCCHSAVVYKAGILEQGCDAYDQPAPNKLGPAKCNSNLSGLTCRRFLVAKVKRKTNITKIIGTSRERVVPLFLCTNLGR